MPGVENLTDGIYIYKYMSKFHMGYILGHLKKNDEIWLLLLLIGLWVYVNNNITEELIDRDPYNGLESSFI